LQLQLQCSDVVDFHRPLLVRRIEVSNNAAEDREIRLFHHQDFGMYGTKVGDTAYFDPRLRAIVHYRNKRYLMATWHADGEQRLDEYATGTAGFRGAEGTWRDAEDGVLGNNPIAQGAVDSTMMISVHVPAGGMRTVYMLIGCGYDMADLQEMHRFLHRVGPQGVIDRTTAYWRLWLAATPSTMPPESAGGPPERIVDLFNRSLLVVRTQIDNESGAIIAANDSDVMQFNRDTYSYLWPRDGALVAAALDQAGFPDVARSFYSLCGKLLTEHGCLLHKYSPDGSPASSWHPWSSLGKPQLPIQEDETALVVWALWRHYLRYRDIEFVRPLWMRLVQPAADFMVRFRDPDTKLPLPSYDLWEERWGVHAFTVATVYAGLQAAWQFAVCFGDTARANTYATATNEMRDAFCHYMWSEETGHFLRRLVPLDHDRTALFMADVLAGRNPRSASDDPYTALNPLSAEKSRRPGKSDEPAFPEIKFERDEIIDSSMYAIWAFGLLDVADPRVEKTMDAIEKKLWVKTPVGGLARYEGDSYHRVTDDVKAVPGNPWFICTLWLADWYIARAETVEELQRALPIIEWVANHASPSGVLAEQVHPLTNAPLSVSPLTWSHATVVATLMSYLKKLEATDLCPTCRQPNRRNVTDFHGLHKIPARKIVTTVNISG
jgi:GH15 family glucan-1,4-alpha-glucosidase